MRSLGVLTADDADELPPQTPQPRVALAKWLTSPTNPLTARVMANRVWQHYFGQGIVATANDFGENGARPTHAELLDHLASRLVAGQWRVKQLDRELLLSSTYRQSSSSTMYAQAQGCDPANRLLWRFPKRRLSAEEIRDSILAVSGQLNNRLGGPSIMVPVDEELLQQLYKPSQWQVTPDRAEHARRSIYLLAKRNLRLPFLEVFDQPTAQTSCAVREQSTHAPQSLELLNGRLANEMAEAFAARLRREVGDQPGAQIDRAFRLAAGRLPTQRERAIARRFIDDVSLREFALAMFNLSAFLYVD